MLIEAMLHAVAALAETVSTPVVAERLADTITGVGHQAIEFMRAMGIHADYLPYYGIRPTYLPYY